MANPIDSANKYRKTVGQLLATYKELLSIDKEFIALDIGNNVIDADFPDITQAQFVDGVSAAQSVMITIAAAQTNLYQVSDGGQR